MLKQFSDFKQEVQKRYALKADLQQQIDEYMSTEIDHCNTYPMLLPKAEDQLKHISTMMQFFKSNLTDPSLCLLD